MRATITNSTVLNIRRYSLIKKMTCMKTLASKCMLLPVVFCVVTLLLSLQRIMTSMSDLLSLIKHVHHGMMSIKSDTVILDQDLIKIVKAYWPNISFYNIEYGLYVAREITELLGNLVSFWKKEYIEHIFLFFGLLLVDLVLFFCS